jgi:hypothetical protein
MALRALVLTAASCALLALPALAQQPAPDKRFEVRAGLSLIWLQNSPESGGRDAVGGLPVEVGFGVRMTPETSIGLFARAAIAHVGGGLELAWLPAGDWSHSGLALRLAGTAVRDWATCFGADSGCDNATYFSGELTIGYRWAFASTGGVTAGFVGTLGTQRVELSGGGVERHFVFGLMAPRVTFDF